MKMKFFNLLAIILILNTTFSFAQKVKSVAKPNKNVVKTVITPVNTENGYKITVNTKNLQGEKLKMYFLYGTKKSKIVSDSITIDSNDQKVEFNKDKNLLGAIYILKLDSQKEELQLAIDNGTHLNLNLENKSLATITCTENNVNKDFIDYQLKEYTLSNDLKIEKRKALALKYPNSVLSLYFNVENKIQEKIPDGQQEKIAFRSNFFKTIDKDDKRMFLLPNISRLLYGYVNTAPIDNDNYIKGIDVLLKGMDCNSKNYAVYIKWFISNLNYFEIKNLEASYLYLYKTYIDTDKCKTFTDAEKSTNSNKYYTILKMPFNSIVPDFTMVDKNAVEYTLSKIYPENDFTFVAFFSPSCHHCQETMPKVSATFKELIAKYPNKKIKLITVINDPDETKWEEFLTTSKLTDWLNLKCTDEKRKYQEDFNAYSNPNFVLIDRTGKIRLKTYNPNVIEQVIQLN